MLESRLLFRYMIVWKEDKALIDTGARD